MAPKRATLFTYNDDNVCSDAEKFITDSGVLLTKRDLSIKPFTVQELKVLIGHIDVKHFLNSAAPEYTKLGFADKLDNLDELFPLISENNSVLRRPIITTERLITIGCDKKKIAEMLQISHSNGVQEESKANVSNSKYVTRRDTTKSSSIKTETTSVQASK